jgi:hypothetical protein
MIRYICQIGSVVLLLAASSAFGQESITPDRRKVIDSVNAAVAKGEFVEKAKEFDLNQTIDFTGAAKRVSGGTKAATEVEFQIGTKEGKPAFITVRTPATVTKQVETVVKDALTSGLIKPRDPTVVMCAQGSKSVCVQTKPDGSCAKWECQ